MISTTSSTAAATSTTAAAIFTITAAATYTATASATSTITTTSVGAHRCQAFFFVQAIDMKQPTQFSDRSIFSLNRNGVRCVSQTDLSKFHHQRTF